MIGVEGDAETFGEVEVGGSIGAGSWMASSSMIGSSGDFGWKRETRRIVDGDGVGSSSEEVGLQLMGNLEFLPGR